MKIIKLPIIIAAVALMLLSSVAIRKSYAANGYYPSDWNSYQYNNPELSISYEGPNHLHLTYNDYYGDSATFLTYINVNNISNPWVAVGQGDWLFRGELYDWVYGESTASLTYGSVYWE